MYVCNITEDELQLGCLCTVMKSYGCATHTHHVVGMKQTQQAGCDIIASMQQSADATQNSQHCYGAHTKKREQVRKLNTGSHTNSNVHKYPHMPIYLITVPSTVKSKISAA